MGSEVSATNAAMFAINSEISALFPDRPYSIVVQDDGSLKVEIDCGKPALSCEVVEKLDAVVKAISVETGCAIGYAVLLRDDEA